MFLHPNSIDEGLDPIRYFAVEMNPIMEVDRKADQRPLRALIIICIIRDAQQTIV